MSEKISNYLAMTVTMAVENVTSGTGGPFAAIVVKNGEIIGKGTNTVTHDNDPSAHAEVNAIRNACKHLESYQLDDCEIYSSCEPCPMCLGAIFWARPKALYFAASKDDASRVGFDDSFIYEQLEVKPEQRDIPFIKVGITDYNLPFEKWSEKSDKIEY